MTTYVYVLKSVASDMTAYDGFKWPFKGKVVCKDFKPTGQCGNGLHGFLWGEGDGCLARWEDDAVWLVIKVKESDVINLGDKVKFPEGEVVFSGERFEAITFLKNKLPPGKQVIIIGDIATAGNSGVATAGYKGVVTAGKYGTATAGYYGTAIAGDVGTAITRNYGTATVGYKGTATAGYYGTATAGDRGTATVGGYGTATTGYAGTATVGDYGTAIVGDYGTATARWKGTATAGDNGTANAGYKGTATAGNRGTATAGDFGTATAGDFGTATAEFKGTAAAGRLGEIRIRYYDIKSDHYKIKVGYIGEGGLKANVAYKLNENYEFVEA